MFEGSNRDSDLQLLKDEVATLRQEINALRSSTSWRITAPLRAASRILASPSHEPTATPIAHADVYPPTESAYRAPRPDLFADEYLVHRRYLRAVFHLRPILPIVRAFIVYDGAEINLAITTMKCHMVLEADALISGISNAHEAYVVIVCRNATYKFDKLVETDFQKSNLLWALERKFAASLEARVGTLDVLEIGSRQRNATRANLPLRDVARSYVGLDILPGPNVDVVGDAHKLTHHLGEQRFDLIYSQWVWEHLAMPWVACAELNRVMRLGAEVFILTNHTMPLHDLPWDFFRFSDSTWISLFNEQTGFEIIGTAMGEGMRVVPHRYHDAHREHEGGLGYLASGCWARKTNHVDLQWPVDPALVFSKLYRDYSVEITD